MKKIVLFNLVFVQSKKWATYHGGGENDYTVLIALLKKIGNQKGWEIYGYYNKSDLLMHDILLLPSIYKNFILLTAQELPQLKQPFHSIYSSDIQGLEWVLNTRLNSKQIYIVIHGFRRYELSVDIVDLFLPNRVKDKIFVLKSFFFKKMMQNNIENYHRKLLAHMPSSVEIIATSNDTRDKLVAMCPLLQLNKVHTLYTSYKTLTLEKDGSLDELILKKYNLESKRFFLLISLGRIEKNVYFALRNLKQLIAKHQLPFKIFCCGESKSNPIINALKKNPAVEIRGYLSKDELYTLYKHAFLFIYPTRSEGFGMPILEAMEHGTPVCCSALSPLIEVGGEAAEYFSLHNQIEFRSKIVKFCTDADFYKMKSQQSLKRFGKIFERQKMDLELKTQLILG